MEFSEEWKPLFSTNSVFEPPLLVSSKPHLGPLYFDPIPETLTLLLSSPSLISPSLLPPLPSVSLPKFLSQNSLPPSLSISLSHSFSPHDYNSSPPPFNNLIQLLHYNNSVLVFFPTGQNVDQVGFVHLVVNDNTLSVKNNDGFCVFVEKNRFNHKIMKILVNPIEGNFSSKKGKKNYSETCVGYLLAFTMYSVHWFSVKIIGIGLKSEKPCLVYLGSKLFKSCAVVDVRWNPHCPEECVVLLESGELFLFDMEYCVRTRSLNGKFKGRRLCVLSDELGERGNYWFGCEFSWHPRILIVARRDAVYLIDLRSDEHVLSCLVRIEMLMMNSVVVKDEFVAMSRAGCDGFYFVLACKQLLLLFDVRKPMEPVLRWEHNLDNPCYLDVFRLSELRSHSCDDPHSWANDRGHCIVFGSFWNCEFSIFCYGPSLPVHTGPFVSKSSKINKSLYAWELPSELLLSDQDCRCGSCLIREEFLKDALPEWVDWQQKKEIVLGFGILNKSLSSLLSEHGDFGGFTLVRLMSSGKLESQRYSASWEFLKISGKTHEESLLHLDNSLLRSVGDEGYKFPKRFQYIKLDYLNAYLKVNLHNLLVLNLKNSSKAPRKRDSFTKEFHVILCEKLKAFGIDRLSSYPEVSVFLKDVSLPTSIHEVAVRRMWAGLPVDILQLGFSSYSKFLEVFIDKKSASLEFLTVPDQPQLPPFFLRKPSGRSNKWSHKVPHSNDLVGPVLPLPILFSLHAIRSNAFSHVKEANGYLFETELNRVCNDVKKVANEISVKDSSADLQNDCTVSLGDDSEEKWDGSHSSKPFFLYKQSATSEESSVCDQRQADSDCKDDRFGTMITKMPERDCGKGMETIGLELFDELCRVDMKFDARPLDIGSKELKAYTLLKRQFSKWNERFRPYQDPSK